MATVRQKSPHRRKFRVVLWRPCRDRNRCCNHRRCRQCCDRNHRRSHRCWDRNHCPMIDCNDGHYNNFGTMHESYADVRKWKWDNVDEEWRKWTKGKCLSEVDRKFSWSVLVVRFFKKLATFWNDSVLKIRKQKNLPNDTNIQWIDFVCNFFWPIIYLIGIHACTLPNKRQTWYPLWYYA